MGKFTKAHILLWLIFSFALPFNLFGQENPVLKKRTDVTEEKLTGNEVVTLRHNSKLLGREMPFRVVFPFSYRYKGEAEKRYPVLILLHGLTGSFENWTEKTKLAVYARNFDFIIVTPEGADGWYTDASNVPGDKYESYVVQELIPEIDARFRTIADREHRAIAGLSMGGYGALKFGLKYPEKFVVAGSFSGALDVTSWTEKNGGSLSGWKAWTDSIRNVYGAEDSQARRDNDIYKIARELSPEKIKNLPFIYVGCGTEDLFFQENRVFSSLLLEKKIPHEFRQLPGKHDWDFWDSQVLEFLRISQKIIK